MILVHPDRTVFSLRGPDVRSFLQGIMTNDIGRLTHDNPLLYSAMLTPQGRYYGDFFLHLPSHEACLYVDVSTDFVEALLKKMRLYKLRAQVEISDVLSDHTVVTIHDQESPEPTAAQDPRCAELGYRFIFQGAIPPGAVEDPALYVRLSLQLGIPRHGCELIPEKTIPLEGNLDDMGAICFTKGCYVGQELTARTKYQGLVRKKLFPVRIEGSVSAADLAQGIAVMAGKSVVGDLLSAEQGFGIAKLRLEYLTKPGAHQWDGILKETKTWCCKIQY